MKHKEYKDHSNDDETIEKIDKETEEYINYTKEIYLAILLLIANGIGRDETKLHQQVNIKLNQFNKRTVKYLQTTFIKYYFLSLRKTDLAISNLSNVTMIIDTKSMIHQKALQQAINSLYSDIAKNTAFMSQVSKNIIRENTRRLTIEAIEQGVNKKVIKRQLRDELLKKGIPSFIDAGRKQWQLDNYVDMLVRTKSRIIHQDGTYNRLKEYRDKNPLVKDEFDLVQVSSHNSSCWCGQFEGKVFSISGNSDEYPSISTLPNQPYNIFHPRCKHVLLPYIPSLASVKGSAINPKWLNKSVKELNKIHYHANKIKA